MLKQRGIDSVCRLSSHRTADFRRGKRLGKNDHIVEWIKPQKPRSVDRDMYDTLPASLMIRECRVQISLPGFSVRSLVIATTLLNDNDYSKDDLATIYRARWNNELDLRSIKITLQMDYLRCKTPELVRKEIWTHALAYNPIRIVMAQAASQHEIAPRTISFKASIQVLEAFQPLIAHQADRGFLHREALYHEVLKAIVIHRVADRPDRFEPRMSKRRPKSFNLLSAPRQEIKRNMLKAFA